MTVPTFVGVGCVANSAGHEKTCAHSCGSLKRCSALGSKTLDTGKKQKSTRQPSFITIADIMLRYAIEEYDTPAALGIWDQVMLVGKY